MNECTRTRQQVHTIPFWGPCTHKRLDTHPCPCPWAHKQGHPYLRRHLYRHAFVHKRKHAETSLGVGGLRMHLQCYDQSMLATLKASAELAEPMWGLGGPHDAGQYKEWPQQCGFFTQKGNWCSSYGRFFLQVLSSAWEGSKRAPFFLLLAHTLARTHTHTQAETTRRHAHARAHTHTHTRWRARSGTLRC